MRDTSRVLVFSSDLTSVALLGEPIGDYVLVTCLGVPVSDLRG